MAERHAAVPTADPLRESIPRPDFSPPAGTAPQRRWLPAAVPLPAGLRARPPLGVVSFMAAVLMVLLARHARRETVTIGLAWRQGGGLVKGRLQADLAATPSVDGLVQALAARVVALAAAAGDAADPVAPPASPPAERGVWLEVGDGGDAAGAAPAEADLVLRLPAPAAQADLGYQATRYRAESIVPLARQLGELLRQALRDGRRVPAELPLMDAAERTRLLRGFNALRVPFPTGHTLPELIEQQARRTPLALCAVHGAQALDFATLDARAGRLAATLVALGVGRGGFVALLDRRGLDFVVAMLAIWKAGAAYIPVDPGYPEERVRLMLADSAVRVVVAGPEALARFATALEACPALGDLVCTGPRADGDRPPGRLRVHHAAAPPDEPVPGGSAPAPSPPAPPGRAGPGDAAYMVYTSGSTGRPKGAIVRHDGAVNHLFAQAHALGRRALSRFLQSAPSSSDISVWQFVAPLAFGGTTVVLDDATDVAGILALVRRHGLHTIELVPAVLGHLVAYAAALPAAERALPSLRWAMVTGESAPVELVNAWLALYPRVPVVNAYGPTEAADDVAQAVLREPLPPDQTTVPIGRPLGNLDLYVLDERLEPLPVGAPGEICVAGVGVGAGYWQQPDKTRAAFVPNPFQGAAGPVIYRTGDLGRWRDDGTLECLGRLDHQVQLRGFRIELQEIEAVLRQHPAVREAAVQAFHDGRGDGQLVAYVVGVPASVGDAVLRAHLAARLPGCMVPAALVRLPVLPLNPAGKVDRRALPPPPAPVPAGRPGSAPPLGPVEQMLARLWSQELGVAEVGRDDDFFALGGDSLAALAIVVGARAAGWHLRSADLLAHPTVARLACVAAPAGGAPASDGAAPAADPALPPLAAAEAAAFLAREPGFEAVWPQTPPQQALYLHWLLARDKSAYVDRCDYDLHGPLDPVAFQRAWQLVVVRHPALRTAFLRNALRQPVQAVRRTLQVAVEQIDLVGLAPAARDQALQAIGAAEVARGFDLAQPPLLRLVLVRLGPLHHRLLWSHHHIVLDGWSLALVLDEVLQAHAALAQGTEPRLPAVVSPERVVGQLMRTDVGEGLAYWRTALAGWHGAAPLGLPSPQPPCPGHGEVDAWLDDGLTAQLAARARARGLTPTTLLQAAWAALLGRIGGQDDLVIGVVSAGRELPVEGIGRCVGLFVTTLPLRVRLANGRAAAGGRDTAAWLAELQGRAAELRAHEAVPLVRIARACGLAPGRALFNTLFVMSNHPAPAPGDDGPLRITPAAFRTVPAYALALVVVPGRRLLCRLVHDRRQVDAFGAGALVEALVQVLGRIAEGEDPRVAAVRAWPGPWCAAPAAAAEGATARPGLPPRA